MGKDRGSENKEEILSARGLMRDVTDVNMKRIRARLAERVTVDSSTFLRHQASKDRGQGKDR
jgi:hypothetical protein